MTFLIYLIGCLINALILQKAGVKTEDIDRHCVGFVATSWLGCTSVFIFKFIVSKLL